jgi:hypothetical protein
MENPFSDMPLWHRIAIIIGAVFWVTALVWTIMHHRAEYKKNIKHLNSADINGKILNVYTESKSGVYMYTEDHYEAFVFYAYKNNEMDFIDVASKGDIVRKAKNDDTIYVVKPDTTYAFRISVE